VGSVALDAVRAPVCPGIRPKSQMSEAVRPDSGLMALNQGIAVEEEALGVEKAFSGSKPTTR
jgi:hypothetical protein